MARRDQVLDADGNEVSYKQWPDDGAGGIDVNGQIDDNGTLRPLTTEEQDDVAQEADEADRDTDRAGLSVDLQDLKDKRDNAQTRFDTITGWADIAVVSRTGNQSAQITKLQDKVDELADRSNQYKDQVRFAWGRIRQLYITCIRIIRAQRLDD